MNTTTKTHSHTCTNCSAQYEAPYTPAAVARGDVHAFCSATACRRAMTVAHNAAVVAARTAAAASRQERAARPVQRGMVDAGGWFGAAQIAGRA